jgi:signal transduction histidine kinase
VLGTEPEREKTPLQNHGRRVPVHSDRSVAALQAELRALQKDYAALKEAHIHLQESDRLRQDLVDMLIHDLKNPISVVLASLDVLAECLKQKEDEKLQDVVRIATHSSEHLLQLVTELLEVKKLESGRFPVQPQPLDIVDLLRKAAIPAGILAEQKRVRIQMAIPEGLPWIWADLNLTARLITNLLENAIRFSPPDATVVVGISSKGKELMVSVSNSGTAIPPQLQERIFEKYYQAEDTSPDLGGVGLGLSFCKLAVEAQRGRIWVESEAGTGVQFRFTLPTWRS